MKMVLFRISGHHHIGAILGVVSILHCCLSADIETFHPAEDFCEGQSFIPECGLHEVIMIHTAVYGRMYRGTCIKDGEIGCQQDVTVFLDQQCSGRESCSVNVVDVFQSIPGDQKPCPIDLRGFLEVSYKCIKVRQPGENCEIHLNSLQSPVGYLSSILPAGPISCGSMDQDQPWVFTGMQEQRIHFIMYDFSGGEMQVRGGDSRDASDASCTVYITIKEVALHEFTTVCKSEKRRHTVYTSKSSRLEVRISKREHEYFLLKFEVQGCISFQVPPGGWVKRSGNVAEVGCVGTSNTWKLHCQDNKWVGTIGNCSAYPHQPRSDASVGDGDSIFVGLFGSHWLAALAISAIAFTVALSILVAGVIYLKRRQVPLDSRGKPAEGGQPYYKYVTGPGGHTREGGPMGQPPIYSQDGATSATTRPFDPNDNEYLKTIERQRLMLIGQHPQQQFAPTDNIRWQDGEHIYELPQFDTTEPVSTISNNATKGKRDQAHTTSSQGGFQKQSFELGPRVATSSAQGPPQPPLLPSSTQDNQDSSIRNVNNRSV